MSIIIFFLVAVACTCYKPVSLHFEHMNKFINSVRTCAISLFPYKIWLGTFYAPLHLAGIFIAVLETFEHKILLPLEQLLKPLFHFTIDTASTIYNFMLNLYYTDKERFWTSLIQLLLVGILISPVLIPLLVLGVLFNVLVTIVDGIVTGINSITDYTVAVLRASDYNALKTLDMRYLSAGQGRLAVDNEDKEFAAAFLGPWSKYLLDMIREVGTENVLFADSDPSAAIGFLGRVKYVDEVMLRAIVHKQIKQIVIIGAGYDCRAWKYNKIRKDNGVRVIEVDIPDVQRTKLVKLQNYFPRQEFDERLEGVAFVPLVLGLDENQLYSALINCQLFDRTQPTLYIIEGVTWYLRIAEWHATLTSLSRLAKEAKGGCILFDAPSTEYVQRVLNSSSFNPDKYMLTLSIGEPQVTLPDATYYRKEEDDVPTEDPHENDDGPLRKVLAKEGLLLREVWRSRDFVARFVDETKVHPGSLAFQFVLCDFIGA